MQTILRRRWLLCKQSFASGRGCATGCLAQPRWRLCNQLFAQPPLPWRLCKQSFARGDGCTNSRLHAVAAVQRVVWHNRGGGAPKKLVTVVRVQCKPGTRRFTTDPIVILSFKEVRTYVRTYSCTQFWHAELPMPTALPTAKSYCYSRLLAVGRRLLAVGRQVALQ